nr:hypothetical protein [uncultured bacterium]
MYLSGLKDKGSKKASLLMSGTKVLNIGTCESIGYAFRFSGLEKALITTLFLKISFTARTREGRFKISVFKAEP